MEFAPVVVFERLGITNTIVISWGIMIFLVIGAYLLTRGIQNAPVDKAPTGRFAIAEVIVEGITSIVDSAMGKGRRGFVPYVGTMALYIVIANLVGLIGFKPPTSDLNTTLGLTFINFVTIQYYSWTTKGFFKRLKEFTEPFWFMTPMNIFGEFTSPISMAFRLFGNMTGGLIIMGLIYWLLPIPLGLPILGHLYFDLFSGIIQTFVFVMLTATFISNAMD
jgi:F-type H+-transporting ATPase subunit a